MFAGLVLLAVGVHWRGAALALVPVVALFAGRFRWTKLRIAVLIATATIMLTAPGLTAQAGSFHIAAFPKNAAFYIYRAGATMSWPIATLAIVGAVFVIRENENSRRLLAMTALVISAWTFHSVVNVVWEDRYLVTAAPAIAALCGAGFHVAREKFAALGKPSRIWIGAMALLICADLVWTAVPLVRKPDLGYHRLGDIPKGITLIAGSALHEGAFVSEMALRDRQLDRIVLRGSKVLASSEWSGRHYQPLFSSPQAVSGYLDAARVEIALIEESSAQQHVRQLFNALDDDPSRWCVSRVYGQPPGVVIFRRIAALPPGDPVIRIDMRRSLGKTIENK
jgi:hypothetical protein